MSKRSKYKVAIVGSNGYIGLNTIRYFEKEDRIDCFKIASKGTLDYFLDLEVPEKFEYSCLNEIDFVVFTAAISSPDICAKQYEKSYQINVIGTKKVIEEALQRNCKIIFLSSDAVFGSDDRRIFLESTETKANTTYGLMKKEIEDCFSGNELFKSLRLSYVISKNDKFLSYVRGCAESGKPVEVFHPFYRNCVTLIEVLETIKWLIFNWSELDSPFLNVCGRELISRISILDEYIRQSLINIGYAVVKPEDGFFKNRHQVTEMSSLYLSDIVSSINKSLSIRLKEQLSYDS